MYMCIHTYIFVYVYVRRGIRGSSDVPCGKPPRQPLAASPPALAYIHLNTNIYLYIHMYAHVYTHIVTHTYIYDCISCLYI